MESGSSPVVAVCSAEALTEAPAGPALRASSIARGLVSHGLRVVLVAPDGSRAPDGCGIARLAEVTRIVDSGATVIASGFLLERRPALARAAHLVVDAAGPFLLENLIVHQTERPSRRKRILIDEAAVLGRLLASADIVLCAHDRQRDLTLGMLLASGALRPELLDSDPSLAGLLLTVPFGPTASLGRIEPTTRAGQLHLVWPGGLWDWLDPTCLIEAIAHARAAGADVSAELWGARSPDPLVPPPRAAARVAKRAGELGVSDALEIVDWVPHSERSARLASADAAVTLDNGGIEARFAFRTRLVDALASGLPVIATEGEFVADEAAAHGAGFTVPPSDPRALARLLQSLLADPGLLASARERAPSVAAGWAYERTIEPLATWCLAPTRLRGGLESVRATPRERVGALVARAQRALNSSTSDR